MTKAVYYKLWATTANWTQRKNYGWYQVWARVMPWCWVTVPGAAWFSFGWWSDPRLPLLPPFPVRPRRRRARRLHQGARPAREAAGAAAIDGRLAPVDRREQRGDGSP